MYKILPNPTLQLKKTFIYNYMNILIDNYKVNRVLLVKHVELNKKTINPDILTNYYYGNDDDTIKKELVKYKDIMFYLDKQKEINKLINIGEIILRNDIK